MAYPNAESERRCIVFHGKDGRYYVCLGGVGLSNEQIQDLIFELISNGTIPVSLYMLPSEPTMEMKQQGKTFNIVNVNGYTIKTVDGKNFEITDKEGNLVVPDSVVINKDEALERNYNMSNDPNAEPDLKSRTR